jgi:hypothetical protein
MEKTDNVLLEVKREKVYPISLDWYWSMPEGDEFLMKIHPIYPSNLTKKEIILKDLREFVEKQISNDLKKGYVRIRDVAHNRVVVVFDSSKWLKDNFEKQPRMKFHLPRTLELQFKRRLPDTLMTHSSWKVVRDFIEDRCKDYLKDHNKTMFKKKMRIMKKVNYNWFDYEANLQTDKLFVRMKPRVMFALAAAGYISKKVLLG